MRRTRGVRRIGPCLVAAALAGCSSTSAPPGYVKPVWDTAQPAINGFPDRVAEPLDLDKWGHKAFALLPKPLNILASEPTNDSPLRVIVKVQDPFVLDKVAQYYCGDCRPETIPFLQAGVVTLPVGSPMKETVAEIGRLPGVQYAEHDAQVGVAALIPNDPDLHANWGLGTIRATESWDITTSKPQIPIAILDTGIDQDHPEFQDKIVANRNFTTATTFDDNYFHGTHVAGIAAAIADNGYGVAGAAPCATLMNVKVLDDTGSGQFSWVAQGIIWAADNGARVINMSLGSFTASQAIEDAVNYAHSRNVVVVAAAGNSGSNLPFYPAYYANAIAVGAVDQQGAKASFSNWGTWVDITAPGVDIYSTTPNHASQTSQLTFGRFSGTSMAAPFVTGVAAQVLTVSSVSTARSRVLSTAHPIAGTGTYWLNGRLDAFDAVRAP